MKNFTYFILLLLGLATSCDESAINEPIEEPTAVILEITCGGTVIQFISLEFGEEWNNNFDLEDGNRYLNVALTEDLLEKGYEEGDRIDFKFIETDQLDGMFCSIGGLPNTKVKLTDIELKN